jgi:hypothetical protein
MKKSHEVSKPGYFDSVGDPYVDKPSIGWGSGARLTIYAKRLTKGVIGNKASRQRPYQQNHGYGSDHHQNLQR